jgi:Ca2+-binding RTX toxin-like protein
MDTTTAFTLVTTVDASANTGGVTAIINDSADAKVKFTGGSGNDTANFGAFLTKDDVANAAEGTDTLQVTQASVTTVQAYVAADKALLNTNLHGFDILKVTDALTSNVDASRFDGINSFVLNAGINAATATLSSVTSGVTVEVNADANAATQVLAVEIVDATLAGNNSDTITLKLNDKVTGGAAAVTDYGVLNAVGADILNISSTKATTSTSTGNRVDIAATSSALDKIVVTGDLYLDINDVALANTIAEVDASGMTLTAVTASGIDVAIATGGTNGVKITGSLGVDNIAGSDAADIIDGGTGNDIIAAGKGNDVITSGAGDDILNFAAGDSSVTSALFDTVKDYTNSTVVGTSDKLAFTAAAGVAGTTALAGWTLNGGVASKTSATVADFIAAVQLAGTANETYAFVSGTDTFVYNAGANGTTNATDDVLIKLVGVVGVAVVTTDTTVANEIWIG